jgi:large subunit ribosomal protein L4
MQAELINVAGEVVGTVDLDETVWNIEPNVGVMHQALLMQQANARLGTHDTKTRGEVRGGGRKPWRQKGTGRARQGSIRSPQWTGGGVVWGPHPRKYTQQMPKRMRGLAVRSALSAKMRDGRVVFIDGLADIEAKTKAMKEVIGHLPQSRSFLIVMPEKTESIERAASNLPEVRTMLASYLNVRDVLKYDRVVVLRDSLDIIHGLWALPEEQREPSIWKQRRLAARQQRRGARANG